MLLDTINCDCDDSTGNSTLAELRDMLRVEMGFADPLTGAVPRPLKEIRDDMLNLLGWGANAANPGPGVIPTLNSFINEAQQTLARRLEMDRGTGAMPARMGVDSDMTALDYQPVLTLAMGMACAHYNKPEAKMYFEQHEKYVGDWANRNPPGLAATLSGFLRAAQKTLVMRYRTLRLQRYFSWPLVAGVARYDFPASAGACPKKLNQLRVSWVGVEEDGALRPLGAGIAPELHSHQQTGRPMRYEFRQCIEIWPPPTDAKGSLIIKGDFGLEPFDTGTDKTSIDEHAVYLFALAKAKAHFKRSDAQQAMAELEVYIRNLVAGTHATRRYIPGRPIADFLYVAPRTVESLP